MKNRLRLPAIILALFMCLNLLPFTAFAEPEDEGGGSGEGGDTPTQYTVTVNYGSGDGNYAAGADVTITAEVPENKQFAAWTGTEGLTFKSGGTTTETAIFTMPAQAVEVTATFEDIPATPTQYTVTVNYGSGDGSYAAGADVTITAEVPENKQFAAWTGTEGLTFKSGGTTTETAIFTMPAQAVEITATFEDATASSNEFTVTVTAGTGGKVTGGGSYAENASATVMATPDPGFKFVNWTESGAVKSTNASYTFTVTADCALTANFENIIYSVTVNNDGNGTATADPTSGAKDTAVTLTATPKNENFRFKEWKVESGGVTVKDNKFKIGTANVVVKAVFEELYKVTVKDASHGKVTADKTSGPKGEKITLTIKPDKGYELNTLEVKDPSGKSITVKKNSFTMPACNVTVTATFNATKTVSYSITAGANGSWIKGTGLTHTITAKRSTDDSECVKYFTGVTIDGNILPLTDYTLQSGSAIVTIKAAALQKLSVGTHTVTLHFTDGTVSTYLYIWSDPRYPATGDERQTAVWAVLTGTAALGMAAVVILGRRYWKKQKNK